MLRDTLLPLTIHMVIKSWYRWQQTPQQLAQLDGFKTRLIASMVMRTPQKREELAEKMRENYRQLDQLWPLRMQTPIPQLVRLC